MNVKNNKRRKESQDKIERAFIELLQDRELKEITVSDLSKSTGLNRSTFYANYMDIYDLADKTREKLENEFSNLFVDYDYFNERGGALKMFRHIKENQIFYKTYFKLCYDDKHLISIAEEFKLYALHDSVSCRIDRISRFKGKVYACVSLGPAREWVCSVAEAAG